MSVQTEVIGPFVAGEVPAPLEYAFLDETGLGLPLSGYAARFSCRERWAAAPTVNGAVAVVTNAGAGLVTYTWTGAEFPAPGHYQAELWVGNGTQRFCSVRLEFDVRAPVGAVPAI